MKWTSPSDFVWEEAPLSSFNTVFYTSVGYVLLTISSTWLSKTFLPAASQSTSNGASSNGAKTNGDTITKSNGTSSTRGGGMTDSKWRPWFNSDLKAAQFLHNVNLVAGSAIMLIGSVYATVQRGQNMSDDGTLSFGPSYIWQKVPMFLFCEDATISSPSLYYWSYLYYLSKYYELLDTFLQLARGKPPPNFVLHVYHHALVLFMAWSWVDSKQSLQLIGLWFNTAVHVVMYTYFLQRTITGKVPRWKSFVTLFQIFQFATSMVCTVVTLYQAFGPSKYPCAGMKALLANVVFNLTLLHSFVDVYKAGKKRKKSAHTSKKDKSQ